MPASPWFAALLALFIWWFSTGAILWRVKSADRSGGTAHVRSVVLALPLFMVGIAGLVVTATVTTTGGVYLAFLSALAVWGWIELAFLSGVITGPQPVECPPGAPDRERFFRAWGALAYHEILLATGLVLVLALATMATNTVGIWTYGILYLARLSAKLNIYFGVPRINTEFLPLTLTHLKSHLRRRSVAWFFPVSAVALGLATATWVSLLGTATGAPATVGYALLATLTALALLEHAFMVLPVPDQILWRWMIPAPVAKPNDN
ncbi:MAG: putative photosynthetic complex assembly protein PuhE [Pseudomonadota bacterium]